MAQPVTQKEYWSGKVGDEWAARARGIDAMLAPMTDDALARARFSPGEAALDIGCGAGATTMQIVQRVAPGGRVVGVDISPPLLAVARARAGDEARVQFLEADAGAAIFAAPFDVAFSRFGVMFFDDPLRAFAHIRSQMKPGGRLVFVCWRAPEENGWASAAIDTIAPMLKEPLPDPDPEAPGPFALADRGKVERILSSAGWGAVDLFAWSGDILVGGGGRPAHTAEFLLHIGPCARALKDQGLDLEEAKQRLIDILGPRHGADGLSLPAACWIVSARA